MLEDVSSKKKGSYIVRQYLPRKIKNDGETRPGIENLRHGRTIAPAGNHYCDGALMIATIRIVME